MIAVLNGLQQQWGAEPHSMSMVAKLVVHLHRPFYLGMLPAIAGVPKGQFCLPTFPIPSGTGPS